MTRGEITATHIRTLITVGPLQIKWNMSAYTENLRHIAEPQAPTERRKAVSTTVEDHVALWFTEALREFAHYGDHEPKVQSDIAIGYVEYIEQKVRDEGRTQVTLYAHTETAASTVMDAVYHHVPDTDSRGGYPMVLSREMEESGAEMFAHYVDDDMAPESPPEPQVEVIDGQEQVVFDADEAKESYAIMKMEEAESEALAEQERRAERAMERGRF